MKHLGTIMIAAMAGVFAIATLTPSGFAQDAAAAWKARSDAMKAQFGAYRRIEQATDPKAAVEAAKAIQASLQKVPSLFASGMDHPDDRAKPEAFRNPADIKAKTEATEKAAAAVVAAAEKGDLNAVKAANKSLLDACNVCHDAYRGPAKGK